MALVASSRAADKSSYRSQAALCSNPVTSSKQALVFSQPAHGLSPGMHCSRAARRAFVEVSKGWKSWRHRGFRPTLVLCPVSEAFLVPDSGFLRFHHFLAVTPSHSALESVSCLFAAQARRRAYDGLQRDCWRHASVLAGAEKASVALLCSVSASWSRAKVGALTILHSCAGATKSSRNGPLSQRPLSGYGRTTFGMAW